MQTFKKEERLCSRTLIKELFDNGSSFTVYPFKAIWENTTFEEHYPVKVIISVSKRNFKRAVDRNRIKRLIREAYRKNKIILYEALKRHDKKCLLAIIYTAKHEMSYKEIELKIILTLQRLIKENE